MNGKWKHDAVKWNFTHAMTSEVAKKVENQLKRAKRAQSRFVNDTSLFDRELKQKVHRDMLARISNFDDYGNKDLKELKKMFA